MGLVHNHPHSWPKPLQPLEHRAFRLMWMAALASNAGSWMQRIATGWLVYSLTGSSAWLGAEAFAAGIPSVLLMPFGGVLADRVNRRKLLITANVINAGLAGLLALAWWTQVLSVWEIIVASFLSGIVSAASVPASQSMLPSVAGEDHLPGAIALNSAQYNAARAIGPALGGVALAWGGPGWCFLLNAVSFLVPVVALVIIGEVQQSEPSHQSVLTSLREGTSFLRDRKDLRLLLLLVGLLAFGGSPIISMLPALAKDLLHSDASSYSILLTCFGSGAICAGVVLTWHPSAKPILSWICLGAVGVGICEAAIVCSTRLSVAGALATIAGACFVGSMIELGSGIIGLTPDNFRGRISSVQQVVFRSAQPVGALLAGGFAHIVGISNSFWAFGGLLAVVAAAIWIRTALRGPQQTRDPSFNSKP